MSLKYSTKFPLASLLLLCTVTVSADDIDQYQKNIADIGKQIESISQNLNANKALLKTQRDELLAVEKEISSVTKAISEIDKRINEQREESKLILLQIEELKGEQDTDRQELSDLIVSQYTQGKTNYIKMLLNQENPYAVGRVNNYFQYFTKAKQAKIQELREKIREHQSLQQEHKTLLGELEITQAKQQDQQAQLESSKQARERTVSDLDSKVVSSSQKLAQLKEDRERLNSLIKQIAEQAEKLRKLEEQKLAEERRRTEQAKRAAEQAGKPNEVTPVIREPVAGGFIKQRGHLSYPVKGEIKYRFGSRLPESGIKAEGMFFNTIGSAPVTSIFGGRVLFSDFLKGYGLLLIIDHGDDHISLYGHNELLYKAVGDTVDANEIVAKTGVTGGLKSPGLYFEIRNNATPIDPTKWFQ